MKRKIKFRKIRNARDLGGLKTKDGLHIKKGMLIRSAHLGDATEKDISVLVNTYKLRNIIDLRIKAEIETDRDKNIPGAEYENLSVLDEGIFGIARDKYSLEAWLNLFDENRENPELVFGDMYRKILFGDRVIPYVKRVFDILLEDREGAVLWHCSAGKDRAGVITVLILAALGVSEEDIIKDYMLTGEVSKKEIFRAKLFLPFKFRDKNKRKCVYTLLGVNEKYITDIFDVISKEYGTVGNFLEKRFDVGADKIALLRKKYLE